MKTYTFSACRAGTNPARCCAHKNAEQASPYARLYIKVQPYTDLACPTYALKNGTFFNDLYMPYRLPEAACEGGTVK